MRHRLSKGYPLERYPQSNWLWSHPTFLTTFTPPLLSRSPPRPFLKRQYFNRSNFLLTIRDDSLFSGSIRNCGFGRKAQWLSITTASQLLITWNNTLRVLIIDKRTCTVEACLWFYTADGWFGSLECPVVDSHSHHGFSGSGEFLDGLRCFDIVDLGVFGMYPGSD